MRLLLAIDADFESLAAVAVMSFLIHNRLECVTVVTPAGTRLERLPAIAKAFDTAFEQLEIPVGTVLDRLAADVRPYFYCVKAIDLVCRRHADSHSVRYLYVDADTLCLRSLVELESLALGESHPVAACSHGRPMVDRQLILGLESAYHYFNAGVMLFDARNLGKVIMINDVVSYYESHLALCRFREQCALNALLKGRVQYLPNQFNYLSWMRMRLSTGQWHHLAFNPMAYCLQDVRKNLAIVHLSAGAIPSALAVEKHEDCDRYWMYLAAKIDSSCGDGLASSAPTFSSFCAAS